jgi:hypothetical protein
MLVGQIDDEELLRDLLVLAIERMRLADYFQEVGR